MMLKDISISHLDGDPVSSGPGRERAGQETRPGWVWRPGRGREGRRAEGRRREEREEEARYLGLWVVGDAHLTSPSHLGTQGPLFIICWEGSAHLRGSCKLACEWGRSVPELTCS